MKISTFSVGCATVEQLDQGVQLGVLVRIPATAGVKHGLRMLAASDLRSFSRSLTKSEERTHLKRRLYRVVYS